MSNPADIVEMPFPTRVDGMAQLAVEAAYQKLDQVGAFTEHNITQSTRIFGKACAIEAINSLCAAAVSATMPDAADLIEAFRTTAYAEGLAAGSKASKEKQP